MPTAAHSAVAELETLFPTEVDVTAGGRTFSIPRYRLRELQSALRLLEPIAACAGALTASENWASLAMRICIVASREDTVAVLAQALGSEPRELHHLKDHELETLGATLLVVNEEMLRPSKATVPTDTGTFSWAQAVSVLLTAGHRFPDIGDYTPAQVRLFMQAAEEEDGRLRAGRALDTLYATRAATAGSEKALDLFNDHLKALSTK